MRAFTASISAGFVGPKLDPVDAAALFGMGVVADTLPQKYLGSAKDWPIKDEPTTSLSRVTRLPEAEFAKASLPTPITARG